MIRNQTTEDMELDIEAMVGQEATNLGSIAVGDNPPPKDELGQDTSQQGVQVAGGWSSFVKGVTGKFSRAVSGYGDLMDPRTAEMLEKARTKQEAPPVLDEETQGSVSEVLGGQELPPPGSGPEASEAVLPSAIQPVDIDAANVQRRLEGGGGPTADDKRTPMRNLNVYRHMQGAQSDPIAGLQGIDADQGAIQVADDVRQVIDAVAQEIGEEHVVKSTRGLEDMTLEDVRQELKPFLSMADSSPRNMTSRQLYATRMVLATVGENVALLSRRVANGANTPEDLLNFQKAVKTHAALQQFLRGNVREVARALQQQTKIAMTLKGGSLNDIDEMMNVAHMTPEQLKQQAKVIADSVESRGPIAGLKPDFYQRINSTIGVTAEYWKASILSGPETHLVNMGGNAIYNAWENLLVRPTAGAIGAARTGIKEISGGKIDWGVNTDRVYMGESMATLASSLSGLRDSLGIAWRTLLDEDDSLFNTVGKAESQGLMVQAANNIKTPGVRQAAQVTAHTLALPFRFLQAEDDLFKTVAYRQEATALSMRQAYTEGLTGPAARKRAGELLEDLPLDLHEQALVYAKTLTYTNTNSPGLMGLMGRAIKQASAKFTILQYVAPFVNTPVNLMQRSIDMSVLSAVSPQLYRQLRSGGAQADVAAAKVALGTAFTALVYSLYADDKITGNGPENWEQRKILAKTGWRPNSFKTAEGLYIPYKRTDPFAASIAGLVDTLEAARYSGKEEDKALLMAAGVMGIARHMMDGTFLRGANDMLAVIDGRKSVTSMASGIAAGHVPYSSFLRSIAKGVDPQPRRTSDDKEFQTGFVHQTVEKIQKGIPVWSRSMRPVRHWDGTVATPGVSAFTYAVSPIKMSQGKPVGAVDRALIANGLGIPEPDPMVTLGKGVNAVHFSLMDLDKGAGDVYDAYFVRVGEARKERLTKLVNDRGFKEKTSGPGGEQKDLMRSAIHKAKAVGLHNFLKEDLLPMYLADAEAFNSIAATLALSRNDLYGRIQDLLEDQELGILDALGEDQLGHIRIGSGRQTEALPVPEHPGPADFGIGFD